MAYGYTGGTITLANGVSAVTGVATAWGGGAVLPGDTLWQGADHGIVAAVAGNTSLTLHKPWVGTSYTGTDYFIQHTSSERHDVSRLSENFARWYRSAPYPIDTVGIPDNAVGVDGWTAWDWTTSPASPVVYRKVGGVWGAAIPLVGALGPAGGIGASGGTAFGQNLLINGSCNINARNYVNGTVVAANAFMLDRWFAAVADTAMSVSAAGVITVSQGEAAQVIEGGFWDLTSNIGQVTLSGDTPSTPLTITANNVSGTLAAGAGRQALSLTPTTGGPNLTIKIKSVSGASFSIKDLKVERGGQASSYSPRGAVSERALCERYYEKSYVDNANPGQTGQYAAGPQLICYGSYLTGLEFRVEKRTTPTFSFWSPTGVSGSVRQFPTDAVIAATAAGITARGVRYFNMSGGTNGDFFELQYVAESELLS